MSNSEKEIPRIIFDVVRGRRDYTCGKFAKRKCDECHKWAVYPGSRGNRFANRAWSHIVCSCPPAEHPRCPNCGEEDMNKYPEHVEESSVYSSFHSLKGRVFHMKIVSRISLIYTCRKREFYTCPGCGEVSFEGQLESHIDPTNNKFVCERTESSRSRHCHNCGEYGPMGIARSMLDYPEDMSSIHFQRV